MEGKEVRFGVFNSALFATVTTDASCGAVNAMHDSFTPVGGLVPLFNIQLGEIVFGGVGAGLYGMLIFVLLAVFIAGLMVGRTPEYLGKKIQAFEVKMSGLVVLVLTLSILGFSAWAAGANNFGAPDPVTNALTNGTNNNGPHGFSEILYAFSSATGNNGSAFAGISANTPWYNTTIGHGRAHRALLHDRADPGHRRVARGQETRPGGSGQLPGGRLDLHHPAHRHGAAHRRAQLPARARARSGRRTLPHEQVFSS